MVIVWDQQLKPPTRIGIKGVVRGGNDLRLHLGIERRPFAQKADINQLSQERKYHIFGQSSIYHHGYATIE